ncbi:hypothetical protein Clacol_001591 [Clathrus columnatus]|uniref:Uncharacterized protein n=1 Tax=Clathrus columnatus TaxID=1419009 RepID=A0AAV5A3R4_9AGAM|nr:hypothetical protein Clacol_001591 [Clathrus columnatus]
MNALEPFLENEDDDSIVPKQPRTITQQITTLEISSGLLDCPSFRINLNVNASPGCGGIAWPAGSVLANYLTTKKSLLGLNVIELGSGTGFVGIVAGLMQAKNVWITDQKQLLDLMQSNVNLNGLNDNVKVEELDWAHSLPSSIPATPDLVLAADCVYYEPAFPLLINTLSALTTSKKTEVLFCYKKRRRHAHATRRTLWTQLPKTTNLNHHSKFFLSNATYLSSSQSLPPISPPSVGYWLLASSALVYGIIVVGGVTRLTESGLSITEWRPISGILPPLNKQDWEIEFNKYKTTPEFKLLNHRMNLDEFKKIFYMEYTHRVLGRLIGITFVVPYIYYAASKRLTPTLPVKLGGLAALIGVQGFIGWYMVKSGLEDILLDTPGVVPRVSQYRLALHLGTALALYAGMLGIGLSVLKDWKFVQSGIWNNGVHSWQNVVKNPMIRRFKGNALLVTGLVGLTALSGAFVAGLDAGLVYNEFPTMGGSLIPPKDELISSAYAINHDKSDLWRNFFENPTTVQFDHRLLAMTTYLSTMGLYLSTLRPSLRAVLPLATRKLVLGTFAVANVQVLLGISTLLYLVPVPVAAAHQAGSVALLTFMIAVMASLRRPGAVARLWRDAAAKAKPVPQK